MEKAKLVDSPIEKLIVWFCPGCNREHKVPVIKKNQAGGIMWSWNGSLDSPTLSPSIRIDYGNTLMGGMCHSWVKNGSIEFCGDCTHHLKGQTVPMKDLLP